MNQFCVIICVFYKERLINFLNNLKDKSSGMDYDLYFVHNLYENKEIQNRYVRDFQEIIEVQKLINDFDHPNKFIIERDNIGEDMGAYHYAFNLLKDKYKYFFFINEAALIYKDNWLKKFYDIYEKDKNILAATPQICLGIRYPLCLPTTYWSITSDFGKKMKWDAPLSRQDSELQEMELVWPQVKQHGGFVYQVETEIFGYKNPTLYPEGYY